MYDTPLGVLAGAVQFLGLIRWPFLVPSLADIYTDLASTQATRDSVAVVFQAFHHYVGVAIGEHLGYIFTSTWTILLCITIIATDLVNPLFGWLGIIPALGVLVGVFEETGFKPAGAINAISYILWSVWLIAFGVALLLRWCLHPHLKLITIRNLTGVPFSNIVTTSQVLFIYLS